MKLSDLQREMQRDLLGGESAIADAIVDAPPSPVQARLDIYRHAYRARLIEALGEVYPMLQRLLGDEDFESLAGRFVETHPSAHRSVRWYGRDLADFLGKAEPFADRPILSELARFEWTQAEVFDAADADALGRDSLQAVDPGRWETLRFVFHPSLRRLALAWNTVAVWRALNEGEEPAAAGRAPAPVPWLLWRQNFKTYFRSLDEIEHAALEAAIAGGNFTDICETLGAHLPEDEIPLRAATFAAMWVNSGIITAFNL